MNIDCYTDYLLKTSLNSYHNCLSVLLEYLDLTNTQRLTAYIILSSMFQLIDLARARFH